MRVVAPRRVEHPVNPSLLGHFPALDPVAEIEGAVGTEIGVGRQHRPDELPGIDELERCSLGLEREGANPALTARTAEVDQEEVVLELGGEEGDARVISQPGWAIGDVGDRRDDVRRLAGERGIPEPFLVPGASAVRRFDELVADPPSAVAPFDHVNPASLVAAVGVIVAGKEVAILIKCQLLRVAEPCCEDLELGAVGIAAQHGSRIGDGQRAALAGLHVESAVADAEIEPAVGPEPQAVQVVTQKADMNAIPFVQERALVGPTVAIGIAELPEPGNTGEPDVILARQHPGADAGGRVVEAVGEDRGQCRRGHRRRCPRSA